MTDEEVRTHAQNLYCLYVEMISANKGYVHNVEDHNICMAACEFSGGKERYEFISYSNPSSLATKVKKYVQSSLVQNVAVHDRIVNRGGMQDEHTEVKLINYLYSVGCLNKSGTIAFFSSRSICKTCASAIADVSAQCSKIGLIFNLYELKAEMWGSSGGTSSSASSASASSPSASSPSASSLSASSSSASSASASSASASSSSASSSSASSSSASSSSASSWRVSSANPSSSAPAVYAYLAKQGKDWLERSDKTQPSLDLKM